MFFFLTLVAFLVFNTAFAKDGRPDTDDPHPYCGHDVVIPSVTIDQVTISPLFDSQLPGPTTHSTTNAEEPVMRVTIRNSVVRKISVSGCRQKMLFIFEGSLIGSMFFQLSNAVQLSATDTHFVQYASFNRAANATDLLSVHVALDRSYVFDHGGFLFVGINAYSFFAFRSVFDTSSAVAESQVRVVYENKFAVGLDRTEDANITFRLCKISCRESSLVISSAVTSMLVFDRCVIESNASSLVETFHGTHVALVNCTLNFTPAKTDFVRSIARHSSHWLGSSVGGGIVVQVIGSKIFNRWSLPVILIEHASYNNSLIHFEDTTVETVDLSQDALRGESRVPDIFCFMCRERDAPLSNVTVLIVNVTTRVYAANMYFIRIGGPIIDFDVRVVNSVMMATTLPRNPFGAMIRFDDEGTFVTISIENSTYEGLGNLNSGLLFFGHKLEHATVVLDGARLVATATGIWFSRVIVNNVTIMLHRTRLGMPSGWGLSVQQSVVRNFYFSMRHSVIDVVNRVPTWESCALCLPASRIEGLVIEVHKCHITHPSLALYLSDQGGNLRQRGTLSNVNITVTDTVFVSMTQTGTALDAILKIASVDLDRTRIVFRRCELDVSPSSGPRTSQQTWVSSVVAVVLAELDEHSHVLFDDFKVAPQRLREDSQQVGAGTGGGERKFSRLSGLSSFRHVVVWDASSAKHAEALVFNRFVMRMSLVTRSNLVAITSAPPTIGAIHFRSCVFKGFNAPHLLPSNPARKNALPQPSQMSIFLNSSVFPCFQIPAVGSVTRYNLTVSGCVQIGSSWISESSGGAAAIALVEEKPDSCAGQLLMRTKCETRQATISTSRTRTHHTHTRSATKTHPRTHTKTLYRPRNPHRECPFIAVANASDHLPRTKRNDTTMMIAGQGGEGGDDFKLDVVISLEGKERYKWRSESLVKHIRLEIRRPYVLLERRQHGSVQLTRSPATSSMGAVTVLRGVDMEWIRSAKDGSPDGEPHHIRLSHPRIDVRGFPITVQVTVAEDLIEEGCRDDFIKATLMTITPETYSECMASFPLVTALVFASLVIGILSHRLHLVIISVQILRCTSSVNCFNSKYTACLQPIFMHAASLSSFTDAASVVIQNCGVATALLVLEYGQEVAWTSCGGAEGCDSRPWWGLNLFSTVGWSRSLALACIQAAVLPCFELLQSDEVPMLGAAGIAFCSVLLAVCFWTMQGFASRNVFFLTKRDALDDTEAGISAGCCRMDAPMFCRPVGRWAHRRAVLDDVERRKEYYALLPCLLVAVLSWVTAVVQPNSGGSACRIANNSFLGAVLMFVLVVALSQPFRLMSTQIWAMTLLVWTVVVVELPGFAFAGTVAGLMLGVAEALLALAELRFGDKWRASRAFAPMHVEEDSSRAIDRKVE